MNTVLSIILGIATGALMYFSIYFCMYRNTRVAEIQIRVSHAGYKYKMAFLDSLRDDDELLARWNEWETRKNTADGMVDRYGYDEMVFSLRPLTYDEWYTETECEIINKYGNED
jgi:hypothetical protein